MKAVIMAGGEGTRLRPITCDKPKPMVNIMGRPMMEYTIRLLRNYGIVEIFVTLHYLPNEVSEFFGDGEDFGVDITYLIEKEARGTAGGVKAAEEFLDKDFVVISGDALTDIDLVEAFTFHKTQKSIATLLLSEVENVSDYGIVTLHDDGRVKGFIEKPDLSQVVTKNVNTGIYVFSPKIFSYLPDNGPYDFSKDLFPKLIESNERIYGFNTNDYWCDVGDISAYIGCHFDIFKNKIDLSLSGLCEKQNFNEFLDSVSSDFNKHEEHNDVFIEKGVKLEDGCQLTGPLYIEKGSKISKNARVGPYAVIGKNCTIMPHASIKRSIIWNNCLIGSGAEVRGAVLCSKVKLKENSHVHENSVIGMKTVINENAIVEPNIRVWPAKKVDCDSIITENLVWGNSEFSKFFCDNRIFGEINIDITPELLTKVGVAWGSVLKKAKVAVSYNCGPSNEMIKDSIISGILSTGLFVCDLGEQTIAITRHAVRFYEFDSAIHLSIVEDFNSDKSRLNIKLIESDGTNISRSLERKFELIFARGDFVRCDAKDIKNVQKIESYKYFYLNSVIEEMKKIKIKRDFEFSTPSGLIFDFVSDIASELEFDTLTQREFSCEISSDGEDLMLIDKNKNKLSKDQYTLIVAKIVLNKFPGSNFILPISSSKVLESTISELGGKVIYSKIYYSDFMKEILKNGTELQFKLLFDATYAVFYITKFLNEKNIGILDILNTIPNIYKRQIRINCPNKNKKNLICNLAKFYKNKKIDLTEGIKIYDDNGWILVLPDSKCGSYNVLVEGFSELSVEKLSNIFENSIRTIANK